MCKRGDIILVNKYKDRGQELPRHSFVVLDDEGGQVMGLPFDFIALVMSSFKDEAQRARKMKFPGNFPVGNADRNMVDWANSKDGYIKGEQFYYFDKSKIDFSVIGSVTDDTFDALVEFIEGLSQRGVSIDQIIDNLE